MYLPCVASRFAPARGVDSSCVCVRAYVQVFDQGYTLDPSTIVRAHHVPALPAAAVRVRGKQRLPTSQYPLHPRPHLSSTCGAAYCLAECTLACPACR